MIFFSHCCCLVRGATVCKTQFSVTDPIMFMDYQNKSKVNVILLSIYFVKHLVITVVVLLLILVYVILSIHQCCSEIYKPFFSFSSRVVFVHYSASPSPPCRALQDCWGFCSLPDLPTCQPHLQIPVR